MIVNLATLDQDQAITQISQLESQLFGPSAWSPNAIRQELNAPARAYWADIDPATTDRKSTRLNSSHNRESRMPSSA